MPRRKPSIDDPAITLRGYVVDHDSGKSKWPWILLECDPQHPEDASTRVYVNLHDGRRLLSLGDYVQLTAHIHKDASNSTDTFHSFLRDYRETHRLKRSPPK